MNLLLALVVFNLAVFLLFGMDKMAAKLSWRRVPEFALLGLSLVAPLAAHFGMQLFHHKTLKLVFLIAVGVGLVLNVTAFFFIWTYIPY